MRKRAKKTPLRQMARKHAMSYALMYPAELEKFKLATSAMGWTKRGYLQQIVHSYFAKHKDYYCQAAIADAEARGMSTEDYYDAMYQGQIGDLKPYPGGKRPIFGTSPIEHIAEIESTAETRHSYSNITLSDYNSVLLNVALLVERQHINDFLSRLIKWHFDEYWETRYEPQIARHQAKSFIPVEAA